MLATWQVGQMFWSFLWFSLFFMWIWMVISIFSDIFRSADLGGWSKAAWTVFIIVLPFVGVLVFLIARGGSMAERTMAQARARDEAARMYIQDIAGPAATSAAEQLTNAAELRDRGVITDDEFQILKARALA